MKKLQIQFNIASSRIIIASLRKNSLKPLEKTTTNKSIQIHIDIYTSCKTLTQIESTADRLRTATKAHLQLKINAEI
jgi:hypothetical protein